LPRWFGRSGIADCRGSELGQQLYGVSGGRTPNLRGHNHLSGVLSPLPLFDMRSLWFIAGNLLRDVAALNNMEMLPWDSWGAMVGPDRPFGNDALVLFDRHQDVAAQRGGRSSCSTFAMSYWLAADRAPHLSAAVTPVDGGALAPR
jgi:hypothetical protein